jgi:enoyl-CoA hydratase/carnithine racemase
MNKIADNFDVTLIDDNKVAIITIQRLEKKNALTFEHFAGLERIM